MKKYACFMDVLVGKFICNFQNSNGDVCPMDCALSYKGSGCQIEEACHEAAEEAQSMASEELIRQCNDKMGEWKMKKRKYDEAYIKLARARAQAIVASRFFKSPEKEKIYDETMKSCGFVKIDGVWIFETAKGC